MSSIRNVVSEKIEANPEYYILVNIVRLLSQNFKS